ncbi:tail tape measure protein [Cereibacter sphaeroides]|uniref:tail tape measure protein n=1 Tax=Cereibacter sphaeroides TaxID=1063 RepID=UPI0013655D4B|nr:tail tape measure protein [Cereibacter sphaeroides]
MSAVIGALRVNLGLDSAEFQKGLKKAQSSLGAAAKAFGALSAIGTTVGAAMTGIVVPTARAANEISRLAQVANTTPGTLQRWSAASKSVGIEQEKLADILKDVNDKVGDFLSTGGGEMKDFFEKIAPKVGVTAKEFRNLSGPQALQLYVSSLEKAGVSQAEMTFYMEAIANDATLLLPLLRNNGAEMERLGDQAADLGAILGDDAVASLRDAHLALGQMATAVSAARDRIAAELAPAVEAMAVAFTNSMREGGLLRGVIDGIGAVAGAVADNIDRLAVYTATAAAALAVSMTPALIVATRAAWAFVAGLVATRAALIRTGLGIAVIAVGELAYQITRAVKAVGGLGNAMEIMGRVARGVWEGMKTSATALGPALNAVWKTVEAGFLTMIAAVARKWTDFLRDLSQGMAAVPGMGDAALEVGNMAIMAGSGVHALTSAAQGARDEAQALKEEARALASDGFEAAAAAAAELRSAVTDTGEAADGAAPSVSDLGDNVSDLGGAAGGAKQKLSDLVTAAKAWKERLKTPVEKYREEIAKLGELSKKGLLSADEHRRAIGELNKELGEGIPIIGDVATAWGDFVAGGLRDFKGFVGRVLGSFKSMLAEMIATAARNRIVIGMGLGGGGVAGTAAAAGVPGMGGGGLGMLGSLFGGGGGFLGSIGSAFSAFGSGALGSLGNFFSGGLSGGFAYIGQSLSMATSGLVGFAQAAGAILGPIAAVAAAFSFFGSKTKLLDAGLRVTVRELNAMVETYKKVEKSRFGGLSKSRRTSYGLADGEVAGPIVKAVGQMQASVMDVADTLGIGAEAFKGFAASVKFSTKGLSDEEIGAKLQEKLTELGDDFAARAFGYVGKNDQAIKDLEKRIAEGTSDAVVSGLKGSIGDKILSAFLGRKRQGDLADLIAGNTLVSTRPELAALVKEGESFVEALQRLSAAMSGVNGVMDTLGHSFRAVDMVTAGMASDLAALFGGLEGLVSATSSYYQAFYSEAERMETATRQATEALAEMGVALPATRAEYRRLVEAQDLTTERGRELYAALVGMAGVMDQILPSVAGLSAGLAGLVGTISTDLDSMISEAGKAQSAAAAAAKGWYQVTLSLRDYIGDLRSAASELIGPAVAAAQSQARYQTMLASAMAGDQEAAKAVSGAASAYIEAVRGQARSAVDVARAQARVLSDLQLLQGVTGLEGAKEDVLASLYREQVDLLTEVRDYLAGGEALKPEQITALNAQLGSLEGAIAAAKEISYAALRERIDVTVGLMATARIPADLRRILKNATSGVEVSLDMVLRRMDLTPDLVWIAAKASSDHLARIDFLAKADALPDDLRALAAVRVAQSVRRLALVMDKPASDLGMAELLKALGAKGGRITLGGSFAFDPSTGFSTWFETTTHTTLTAPMGALRTALDDLRDAIRAQERAAGQRERGAALSAFAGGLASNAAGDILATDKQIMAMAAKAGISTDGKTIGQVMRAIEGFSPLDGIETIRRLPGSLKDYLWGIFQQRQGRIPLDTADYLRLYPDVAADEYGYDPTIHYRNHGREAILAGLRPFRPEVFDWSAIGLDVPGFAAGGLHAGGLRLVGELGPELEATGPSRIHSAGRTADILGGAAMGASEVAGAVRDLQAELVALRAENAQIARELAEMKVWARKGAEASTATAKDLRRIGTVGVRIDPTEAV